MIERQTRNLFLRQRYSRRSFCAVSGLRVWCCTGEEGAVGGLEICCGARAVHHTFLGHPTTTLSHHPPFPGGQSYRQALQLPTPWHPRQSYVAGGVVLCEHLPTWHNQHSSEAQPGVLAVRASCHLGKGRVTDCA